MAHLADLLGHDHPLFVYNLAKLEQAVGGEGIDNRLLADCTEKARGVMRELGLDVADTLSSELYQALNAAVRRGDAEKILKNTQYVLLMIDDEAVSFNIRDVIENAHHELHFADRELEHARRHLRQEIIRLYAEHEKTDAEMVHRLVEEAGLKPDRDVGHQPIVVDSTNLRPTMYAVGDIFSDVFIQLIEDETAVDVDDEGRSWLRLPFGSKPPYEDATTIHAVGPSPNAGVCAARLGLKVDLLAWLGNDRVARQTREYLDTQGVGHSHVTSDETKKSNTYYVLRRNVERTILVKNEDYAYEWQAPDSRPDWLYLSLISEKSWRVHEDMLAYLEEQPEVKLAFQPGTFHFRWGVEKCAPIYRRATMVVLNREEAVEVTGGSRDDVRGLLDQLRALGPDIAIITDGSEGSYASYGDRAVLVPKYHIDEEPVDSTGAGDAFASTVVAALALGLDMETSLKWASINSSFTIRKLGAQAGLRSRSEIERLLKDAPKDFEISDISD